MAIDQILQLDPGRTSLTFLRRSVSMRLPSSGSNTNKRAGQ